MTSRADILRLTMCVGLACAGTLEGIALVRAQQDGPVLTIEHGGDGEPGYFRVNGRPKFLLFISYFDAMRRSDDGGDNEGDLDTDFAYLKAKGFDGIRMFPNWWKNFCTEEGKSEADDGLFTTTSELRTSKIDIFLRVLDKAAAHGLLVDVSFTRETLDFPGALDDPTMSEYEDQIVAVAKLLKGRRPHVFFDLQNEFNNNGATPADIISIANAVRAADPNRYMTASTTAGDAEDAGEIAGDADLHLVAVHPDRRGDWWEDIADAVTKAKMGMGTPYRPIYFQEPMPISECEFDPHAPGDQEDDPSSTHQTTAAAIAKVKGAAAYTLHTRRTMRLADESYVEKLSSLSNEESVVENLAPYLNAHPRLDENSQQ